MFYQLFLVLCTTTSSFSQCFDEARRNESRLIQKAFEAAGYFQGDMRFGGECRNALTFETMRWVKGVVRFEYFGDFTQSERHLIESAMWEIQSKTGIRFVHRSTNYGRDYVLLNNNASGCWSFVGRVGGAQPLNLQTTFPNGGTCMQRGIIMHELLHVLGLHHQHSARDRDEYVEIVWDNFDERCALDYRIADNTWNYSLPYDYLSIMHYCQYTCAINQSLPSMITKNPDMQDIIGQRVLSSMDILKIKRMYANQREPASSTRISRSQQEQVILTILALVKLRPQFSLEL